MCHKAPNASSPTHTHTYTLLRCRKRGNRGDREDGVEDWGWGRWRGRWRQTHSVPAGVVPPSRDSYFTICLTEHTHRHTRTKTPLRLSWASHPSHMCLLACTRLVHKHTHTRSYTCTHTHAGVTVRQMSGGSSQCNSPLGQTLIHLDILDSCLCLSGKSQSETDVKNKKKQSTVAELWKGLLNWSFIYANDFSLLDWIES